jgi:RNA polymerase sigma-70 factor (ECF subfamily)
MASPSTSQSLLERARRDPADGASWRRLLELYQPLIRGWVRPNVSQAADADDLVQEVLGELARALPGFEHNRRPGAFRAWLKRIALNRLRTYWRTRGPKPGDAVIVARLEALEDPSSGPSQAWDEEHDRHVAEALLEAIRLEFRPATWRAFEATVRDGLAPSEVAAELGLTPNAVLIAKSRVLKRLREKGAGLID